VQCFMLVQCFSNLVCASAVISVFYVWIAEGGGGRGQVPNIFEM
jgi:hypothetical protein